MKNDKNVIYKMRHNDMKKMCEMCHSTKSIFEFPEKDVIGWCFDCMDKYDFLPKEQK